MAELAHAGSSEGLAAPERDRSYFWRRLHSLTGIVPVGLFLLFHIFENTAAIAGADAYDTGIAKLASLLPPPYFYLIEIGVIIVPIAFHGFYGAYLSFEGRPNVGTYAYRRNYLYLLQRISGIVALVFIAYHVVSLRVMITMLGKGQGVSGHPGYISFADMIRHYADPAVLGLYVVGTLSAAFHFGNGLNGFAWTWGLVVGERGRKVVEWLGWAVFVALSVPMLHILWSFRNPAALP